MNIYKVSLYTHTLMYIPHEFTHTELKLQRAIFKLHTHIQSKPDVHRKLLRKQKPSRAVEHTQQTLKKAFWLRELQSHFVELNIAKIREKNATNFGGSHMFLILKSIFFHVCKSSLQN